MTPGKLAGMKAVSDQRGVIAAAAMDQRGSLQKALAKEKGGEIGDREMEEFKSLVTEVLTPHASAILLDPEWGIPASKRRAKNAGLLMAYEKTGYDATTRGRLPDLLDVWSVRRLKENGADCIKILLYYAPDDSKDINELKHAWVERIGDECRANDIPFFLEFIGYEDGVDEKGLAFAKKKPEIVARSMAEFTKDRYGVDVHEGRDADQHEVRRRHPGVRRPEGVLEAGSDGSLPPHGGSGRPVRSFTCRPASATRSSPSRWISLARRGRAIQACCAAGRRGRTGSRSMASRARMRSASGWKPRA